MFEWSLEGEATFQSLKRVFYMTPVLPVLGHLQLRETFTVDTDISNTGLGGLVSQVQKGHDGL